MGASLAQEKKTIWNRNFICTMIGNACLCLSHSSVNTLVATYATYLGATDIIMGMLTGMFFGVALAMRPVAGPAMTKIDHRKLMILVFALGGFVNLGYALFHNVAIFVIIRFLHGVQYSIVGSLLMTMAGDSLPKEKMASGLGIYGVSGAAMTAIGPSIGIFLRDFGTNVRDLGFGFTLDFLFSSVVLFIAVIPGIICHPDNKSKEEIKSAGVWYKNIIASAAIPTTIVMTLLVIGYSLYNSYIVSFAAEQGIESIGAFYTVLAGVMIVTRPVCGKLMDKYGLGKILLPGLICFGISFLIVGSSRSLPMVLLGAAVAAMGYGSSQPALQAMCLQCVPPIKRSVASNTLYTGIDLGFFVGPLLGSIVMTNSNYATMFLAGAVPIVLCIVCFIFVWPMYVKLRRQLDAEEAGMKVE